MLTDKTKNSGNNISYVASTDIVYTCECMPMVASVGRLCYNIRVGEHTTYTLVLGSFAETGICTCMYSTQYYLLLQTRLRIALYHFN